MKILLASSSPYRKSLLSKLQLSFDTYSPDIDETQKPNETPEDLVLRLSFEKAIAAQQVKPEYLVLASDQVAYIKEGDNSPTIMTKPNNEHNAIQQLSLCSGKTVRFITGLCCLPPKSLASLQTTTNFDYVDVTFRQLSLEEISNYIRIEQPLDCAGSFKAEGLGISLFDKIESSDPNTIVGLSLIAVNKALIKAGINPLLTIAQ